MGNPTRFPAGINNVDPTAPSSTMAYLDPTTHNVFFEDFQTYVAGDWTITSTGSPTTALADAAGGVLSIATGATDDNNSFYNKKGESFQFVAGKELWFKCRFSISDAIQSDLIFGLQITDTTPLAVTDGVYFRKDDGDSNVDFVIIKNSTATTATAITTLSNSTMIVLEFYYNGVDSIKVYADGLLIHTATTLTNLPDDELLTVSFGVQTGEAAAKTLLTDYILAVKER